MKNAERIESKIDGLAESVGELREGMATMMERTEQMQMAQLTAAKTRAATCPMTSVIAQYGVRVDSLGDDISEDRVDMGNLKTCAEGLKKDVVNHGIKLTTNKRLMTGTIGLVSVVGIVVGVLAAVGVI